MIVALIIIGLFGACAIVVSIRVERKLIHNSIYCRDFAKRIERLESKQKETD